MSEAVYLAVGLVVLGCCVQGLASMFSDSEAYIALAVMGKFLVVVGLMLLSLMFMESLPMSIDVGWSLFSLVDLLFVLLVFFEHYFLFWGLCAEPLGG